MHNNVNTNRIFLSQSYVAHPQLSENFDRYDMPNQRSMILDPLQFRDLKVERQNKKRMFTKKYMIEAS